MEGVYLLRSNGTITSLLGGYSKNFEKEAFNEFGEKTKQFGHLFDTDFVKICNRKVFSFNVTGETRLSFVFNKDHLSLTKNPTPSQLFTLAFKSFTSKLIPKSSSSPEGEECVTFGPEAKMTQKPVNPVNTEDELMSLTCLFRSCELLLRLAFDYENYVATRPNPVFPTSDWESMLGAFKDEIRIAAVRSSCTLAAQLCNVQDQLANLRQALETSRSQQNERSEGIEVLSTAVQTLSLHLEKTEQKDAVISSQQSTSLTPAIESKIPVPSKVQRIEENNLLSEKKSTDSDEGLSKDSSEQREDVSTDSNPAAEEKIIKGANELEKRLSASENTIFYLQRDLAAMKLERDSYYHQILELRRARQIYETKRHQEMIETPPPEPPGFTNKKPIGKDFVATANGKTNTLNGQVGQRKLSGQAGQRIGPILQTRGEEL